MFRKKLKLRYKLSIIIKQGNWENYANYKNYI